jgi:hypothetical protein
MGRPFGWGEDARSTGNQKDHVRTAGIPCTIAAQRAPFPIWVFSVLSGSAPVTQSARPICPASRSLNGAVGVARMERVLRGAARATTDAESRGRQERFAAGHGGRSESERGAADAVETNAALSASRTTGCDLVL